MTSQKKINVLALTFLILTAAAAFLWFRGKPQTPSMNPLQSIDVSSLQSIVIETKTSTMTFEQRNGAWSMTQPVEDEVEPTVIDRLVVALKAFTLGSVVSENPDNYSRFQLAVGDATRLRVYAAGQQTPALDGYVGKSAANHNDSFFRLEGKKPVLVAAGLPNYLFKGEPRQYRLSKVFSGDVTQADSIEIKLDKKVWTINRSSDTWTMANLKVPVTSFEIKAFAGQIGQWIASEFGGPSDSAWILNSDGVMAEITVMRGSVPTLIRIGKQSLPDPTNQKRDDMKLVTVEGRKYVMGVSAATLDAFFTQLKSFK